MRQISRHLFLPCGLWTGKGCLRTFTCHPSPLEWSHGQVWHQYPREVMYRWTREAVYSSTFSLCFLLRFSGILFYLRRSPFFRSGQSQITGSGQFKWKDPRRARTYFPATTLQIPTFWPTGAGELSGSRAFHLETNCRSGQSGPTESVLKYCVSLSFLVINYCPIQ